MMMRTFYWVLFVPNSVLLAVYTSFIWYNLPHFPLNHFTDKESEVQI